MAIKYEISTWSSPVATKATEYRAMSRGGEATSNEVWRQIHLMLEGDGGLDTERGWHLWREFLKADAREDFAAPPMGCYRSSEFILRVNDPMSPRVKFWAQRI